MTYKLQIFIVSPEDIELTGNRDALTAIRGALDELLTRTENGSGFTLSDCHFLTPEYGNMPFALHLFLADNITEKDE